jgi:multimeric flavodoxin WrbA
MNPFSPPVAVFASSRRNGNTGQLMDRIAQQLGIEVIDLAQKNISPYDYQHRNRQDDFEPLMEHLLEFKQWIFASPEYWYAVSPPMKVFLDRISDYLEIPELLDRGRRLKGKWAYVVCTSVYDEVSAPFIGAFRETFSYLGMHYGGLAHVNCRDGYNARKSEGDVEAFVRSIRAPGAQDITPEQPDT